MSDKNNLINNLPSLIDTFDESAESILDSLMHSKVFVETVLNNEALKEVPVVNFLTGIYKVHTSVKDYKFIRNFKRFLNGVCDIPINERVDFSVKYFNTISQRQHFTEKILDLLSEIDLTSKVDMLVLFTKKLIYGKITAAEYLDLIEVVKDIKINWLDELFDHLELKIDLESYKRDVFFRCGILSIGGSKQLAFVVSPLGKLFSSIIFEEKLNDEYRRQRIYYFISRINIKHVTERDLKHSTGGELKTGSFEIVSDVLDRISYKSLLAYFIQSKFAPNQFSIEHFRYDLYRVSDKDYLWHIRDKDKDLFWD